MSMKLIMTDSEIVSRYKDMDPGVNRVRILAELNAVGTTAIEEVLHRNGVPFPPRRRGSSGRPLKVEHKRAFILYEYGLNDCQISLELGCNPATIRAWRRRNDLPAHGKNSIKNRHSQENERSGK